MQLHEAAEWYGWLDFAGVTSKVHYSMERARGAA